MSRGEKLLFLLLALLAAAMVLSLCAGAGGIRLHALIRALLEGDGEEIAATLLQDGKETPLTLKLPGLTREERDIILAGCLINYSAQ